MAKRAGAIGVGERHHDKVALLHLAHVRADVLDDADRLVAHAASRIGGLQLLIRPEVAAADAGACDAHKRVGGIDNGSIGHVLDTNVAGTIHNSCTHDDLPPVRSGLSGARDDKCCFDVRAHMSFA